MRLSICNKKYIYLSCIRLSHVVRLTSLTLYIYEAGTDSLGGGLGILLSSDLQIVACLSCLSGLICTLLQYEYMGPGLGKERERKGEGKEGEQYMYMT